ncbi:hypothetical protein [Enterococcus alishanensis]
MDIVFFGNEELDEIRNSIEKGIVQQILQKIQVQLMNTKKAETSKHSDFLVLVGNVLYFPLFYPFYNNTNAVKSTLWRQLHLLFYSHSVFNVKCIKQNAILSRELKQYTEQ